MKYMKWSDLKCGDILQFTDEYISANSVVKKCKDKDLIVIDFINTTNYITIILDKYNCGINHNGTDLLHTNIVKFKIIKLKERL